MIFLRWLAAIVLFLQLPVPLFWFVLHPQIRFWRRHQKAAYITALALSWPVAAVCLIVFRDELLLARYASAWRIVIGVTLIIFESWIFWRAKRDLGTAKLIGKTELSGDGEVVSSGIYGRMRNPRYVGSFIAIIGACLVAATRMLWIVAMVWTALMLIVIAMEEREMRTRFGASYMDYCRRVPRFLPF